MRGQNARFLEHGRDAAPHAPKQPTSLAKSGRLVWRRMRRVLTLDRSVYAEIERDPAGTRQAVWVVAVVAAAAALGTVLIASWHPGAVLGAVLAALLHWLLWSGLIYLIASVLYGRRVPLQPLVRGLGYAQTPQLLAVLAFVPVVGAWVGMGSGLLTMLSGNLAIGDAFGLSLRQALAIRLVSFGIALAAAAGVRAVLGDVSFITALLRP